MSAPEHLLEGRRVHVFCRIVDNFGDAGVCWRLARTLMDEQGAAVSLWIDHLPSLAAFVPSIDTQRLTQVVDGIALHPWSVDTDFGRPAEVVIEAFGCGLPESYIAAMAACEPRPVWIILEYLSAEEWVASHHRLPSPHPCWTLDRYFFFPGFVHGTGGVLRERDLALRHSRFTAADRGRFWSQFGLPDPTADALRVSLFAYDSAPLEALYDVWANGAEDVVVALPAGKLSGRTLEWFGLPLSSENPVHERGRLQVRRLPFLPHRQYDELLGSCDLNFVRGEDSFVRAQWAEQAFVWQIYPQADLVHRAKLDAFLKRYTAGLSDESAAGVVNLFHYWNGLEDRPGDLPALWTRYARARPALAAHALEWSERLQGVGSLTDNLAQFCSAKLK